MADAVALNLALDGEDNVGKHSLQAQYFGDPDSPRSDTRTRNENIDGNLFPFSLATDSSYDPHGILFVFDLTNRDSFEKIPAWIERSDRTINTALVGNKCDLVDKRVVRREEAEQLAAEHGMKYFETTATNRESARAPIVEMVRALVRAREASMTAVIRGASGGDVEAVERAVSENRDAIDERDKFGWTAMHHAAKNGHVSVIETLVRLGSKALDTPNNDGEAPLHAAAYFGHGSALAALVRLGSKAIDTLNSEGFSPLYAAASNEHVSEIEALVRLGSKAIDTPNKYKCTPLIAAASKGHVSVIEALARLGSKAIDTPDKYGRTPLYAAAQNGQVSVIEALVRLGSKAIDTPNIYGCTPLFAAASNGHVPAIETLVRLGSNAIDTPDKNGWTPLHEAAENGHVSVIEALIRLGSHAIDTPGSNSLIPMHLTSQPNVIETLFRCGSRFALNNPEQFFARMADYKIWQSSRVFRPLGVSHRKLDNPDRELSEDEAAEVRYRVYFSRSLVACLLESLNKQLIAQRR